MELKANRIGGEGTARQPAVRVQFSPLISWTIADPG